MLVQCLHCGKKISHSATVCPECHGPDPLFLDTEITTYHCRQCQGAVQTESTCPHCDDPDPVYAVEVGKLSSVSALLTNPILFVVTWMTYFVIHFSFHLPLLVSAAIGMIPFLLVVIGWRIRKRRDDLVEQRKRLVRTVAKIPDAIIHSQI